MNKTIVFAVAFSGAALSVAANGSSLLPSGWRTLDVVTFNGERIHVVKEDARLLELRIEKPGCSLEFPRKELDLNDAVPFIESTSLLGDEDETGDFQTLSIDFVFVESPDRSVQSHGRVEWKIRDCRLEGRTIVKE